ncbi:MAG: hypothetical protein IJ045_03570, partial [Ruminiclostridium sp.]|nr:hypothetical protein [Ruminiclostridium sp.]
LNQNESLVTKSDDGSGFSELAGGLGDYKVTINKVKGDAKDEIHVLEIEVSIDVNGENSTISTIGEFKVKSKPYNFDRFFTSTGYAPNDVIFKNMKNHGSTIFLDNEYTQFGGTGAGDLTITAELISAGSVRFEAPTMLKGNEQNQQPPVELTVGNNAYFFGCHGDFDLKSCRIGGNAVILSSYSNPKGIMEMYVLQDLYLGKKAENKAIYVNGDAVYLINDCSADVYVNGDLFLQNNNIPSASRFWIGGNVYCATNSGTAMSFAKKCKGAVYNLADSKIYKSEDGTTVTVSSMETTIDAMVTTTYLNFNLKDSTDHETDEEIRKKLDYVESICGTVGGSWANVWPSLNGTCEDVATVKQRINEKIGNPEYINWDLESKFYTTGLVNGMPAKVPYVDSSKQLNLELENDKGTVIKATTDNDYYILKSIKGGNSRSTVIFDTFMGDYNDPMQVADKSDRPMYANMYIYLEPNCYVEDGAVKVNDPGDGVPDKPYDSFSWNATGGVKFILTRGMGSVTFVVPDGVRYIQPNQGYLGHMGMLEKLAGIKIPVTNNGGVMSYGFFPIDQMPTGMEDNIRKNLITNAMGTKNILSDNVINEYNNPNDPAKAFYIHNNVFLATISKNAIMDFSGAQNMYCGFIYAPYMTYNSEGIYTPSQSGMIGGMIVSDFIQSSENDNYVCTIPYDYYNRYVDTTDSPEDQEETRTRFMEKLMAESGCTQILTSSTTRTWRKFGYN